MFVKVTAIKTMDPRFISNQGLTEVPYVSKLPHFSAKISFYLRDNSREHVVFLRREGKAGRTGVSGVPVKVCIYLPDSRWESYDEGIITPIRVAAIMVRQYPREKSSFEALLLMLNHPPKLALAWYYKWHRGCIG